jgi:RHS repeat-associated protein
VNPADEDPDANSVAFDLPLRLPGQRYDKETNLHYNYFRDYDPSIGRYGESDPIGLKGGPNAYAYAAGDPIHRVDPLGLFSPAHHDHMTRNVAGECPKFKQALPPLVVAADFDEDSQEPVNAFRHGMCNGPARQSPDQGDAERKSYVDAQLRTCTAKGLANALHAEQDKHSRPHKGCKPWFGGFPGWGHIFLDTFGAAGGPFGRAEADSRELIKRFKELCPCACNP